MSVTLAVKYRPTRWDQIVGQRAIRAVLAAMVQQDNVPQAILLSGSKGLGKTSIGRILAMSVNCPDQGCGSCEVCASVIAGSYPAVTEFDAASHGSVSAVRELLETLKFAVSGTKRIWIIDEAQSLSKEAVEAFLKTLEEPPPDVIFVFITTEPQKLLDTLRSRVMAFEFQLIAPGDIADRLRLIADAEGLTVTPELLAEIAQRSSGGLRDAIMLFDQVTRVGVQTVDHLNKFLGIEDHSVSILQSLMQGDLPGAYKLVDLSYQRSGDARRIVDNLIRVFQKLLTGEALLAPITQEQILKSVRVLWDYRIRLQDSSLETLYLAIALLYDALSPKAEKPDTVVSESPLSLEQMEAMVK